MKNKNNNLLDFNMWEEEEITTTFNGITREGNTIIFNFKNEDNKDINIYVEDDETHNKVKMAIYNIGNQNGVQNQNPNTIINECTGEKVVLIKKQFNEKNVKYFIKY